VAIKLITGLKNGASIEKYVLRELQFIQTLAHPNVVQFLGTAKDPQGHVLVVSEWAARGDLRRYLYGAEDAMQNVVSWEQKCVMLLDLAQAVYYLHSRCIIHRDLKGLTLVVFALSCLIVSFRVSFFFFFFLSRVFVCASASVPVSSWRSVGGTSRR
jgi:serine/threonine protein kinase